ncbi:hypothetical protein FOZ62_014124, partial [Perkinsus olseni]
MYRFIYGYGQRFVSWLWDKLCEDLHLHPRYKKKHLLELLRVYKQNPDYHEYRTRLGGDDAAKMSDLEILLHGYLLKNPYIPQSLHDLPRIGGNGPFRNVVGHVDVFPIRIRRPTVDQDFYYQPKYKSHVIKVQAVVDISGRIVHISLPWIGARHDLYIYRKTLRCRVLKEPHRRRLMADLGYATGHNRDLRLIIPHKRVKQQRLAPQQLMFNARHASVRSRVERAFGFLKRFDILYTRAR